MASNDEVMAMQLHKQLNAISLRTRRGHGPELGQQLSFDRCKRDRGSKPRSKRTSSSSQDHPSGKKQRTSDEHGHTSARQRPIKRDPEGELLSLQTCTCTLCSTCNLSNCCATTLHNAVCATADSNPSQDGSDQQHQRKHADGRHSVSRDSEQAEQRALLLREPDPMQLLQSCSQPIQAAAMYAAHKAKQQAIQQHAQQPSQGVCVRACVASMSLSLE
jgi:hypothetical protein